MSEKLIDWLFGVIARPVQTLNDIARERPVGLAVLVYLGVALLVAAASYLSDPNYFGLDAIEELRYLIDLHLSVPLLFILELLLGFIGLLVSVAILHLVARIFKGTGGFWNFFSAYAFSEFPSIFIVPVIFISAFLGAFGVFLSGAVNFGLAIWTIVLGVIAIRESQGISTGAAVAVILIPLAVLVILAIIVVLALLPVLFTFFF